MSDNILGLAPILTVTDPRRSAEWYRDKLGFHIVFVTDFAGLPTYGVIRRGGAEIHLMSGEPKTSAVSIQVRDVDAFFAEIESLGALPEGWPRDHDEIHEHPPEDKEYGRRDMFLVTPDETVLNFGQNRWDRS